MQETEILSQEQALREWFTQDADPSLCSAHPAIRRMRAELERQFATPGYHVPFGPIRMVVAQKRA